MASAKCRYLKGDARNVNISAHRTDSQCKYQSAPQSSRAPTLRDVFLLYDRVALADMVGG
jgi:hypothetical protein